MVMVMMMMFMVTTMMVFLTMIEMNTRTQVLHSCCQTSALVQRQVPMMVTLIIMLVMMVRLIIMVMIMTVFICNQVTDSNWIWVVIFVPGENGDFPSVCLPQVHEPP